MIIVHDEFYNNNHCFIIEKKFIASPHSSKDYKKALIETPPYNQKIKRRNPEVSKFVLIFQFLVIIHVLRRVFELALPKGPR